MNRRDILSALASWATAASAVAASDTTPLPTAVPGWPAKQLPTVLHMDATVHHVPPEKTLLVFRLTQCVNQEMVESLRSNIRSWVRDSRIDCAAILLPYGLELDVHRIPADTSLADGSVSPKE